MIEPAWGKVQAAARYSGLAERTVRKLLKKGLPHSRLPSGTILIRFSHIDEFLNQFGVAEDQANQIAEDILTRHD